MASVPSTSLSSLEHRFLFVVAAWASFATMAVEMLFARIAASYFGSGIAVWGSIITVLLLAMAVGCLWGGRLSQKPRPHSAVLYRLVLALSLSMLPLVLLAPVALAEISYWLPDSRYGSLLGAALLLSAPGVLAGVLAPYITRLIVTRVEEAGSRVGQLSAVTTLGSAAGTIVPSYYLVLWLEINTILLVTATVTAMLAIIGLLMQPPPATQP